MVPDNESSANESCSYCDTSSLIPHGSQITRVRVNNLCCSGEEKLIRTCLENIKGIENVAINIVGRYAVVKHCPVVCCAPADKIVEILNEKYLGASIQEVAGEDGDLEEESKIIEIVHVLLVTTLFLVGLILEFVHEDETEVRWIYIASVIVGIWPLLYSAVIAVFVRYTVDIHVLMIIAIVGATASGDYFDGSLVVALFLGAELIEQMVLSYVRKAVQLSSAGAIPKFALLVDGTKVPTEEIQQDMVICARAGEMILADGIVVKGEAVVDESALSGECVPIHKSVGEEVRSGTIVQNGYVEVRAAKAATQSTLQQLRQEVQDVQADRGKYARMVDEFALYWTPAVLVAAAAYVIGVGLTKEIWSEAAHRGLLILVLACPCAIVISAPIPAVCAIANASRHGVLIRGSSVVERMGTVQSVALDKTGTLTKGLFRVTQKLVLAEDDEEAAEAMSMAAAVEEKSTHPLADAVVAEHVGCIADMSVGSLPAVRKVKVIEGVGVGGWVESDGDWKYCVVGNERILKKHGGAVHVSKEQEAKIETFTQSAPNSVCLFVAVEDELMLLLALSDQLRPESERFIQTLRGMSMAVTMLTGDSESAAKHFSGLLGINLTACHYRLLPQQKLQWIRATQHKSMPKLPAPAAIVDRASEEEVEGKDVELQEVDVELGEADKIASSCCDSIPVKPLLSTSQSCEAAQASKTECGAEREDEEGDDLLTHAKSQQTSRDAELEVNMFSHLAEARPQRVLMVGDGINDSVALAAADVGVAMGAGGSAMAVTAADVVLLSENLLLIPGAVRLCQVARAAMLENCQFAIGIKVVAIVLALLGYLEFWHAILIDLGSLLVVVLNGTRILQVHAFVQAESADTAPVMLAAVTKLELDTVV